MSNGPGPIPDNSPVMKPRGHNAYVAFLTVIARDVPKQLQRSAQVRASIRRGRR